MLEKLEFGVDEEARAGLRGMKVGYVLFEGTQVERKSALVDRELEAAVARARGRFKEAADLPEENVVKGIRALFSRVGTDPTKERPSGEALLRRAVQGEGLYRINSVVDLNNVVSMEFGHPCGVYDADRLAGGKLVFGTGGPGDRYAGIAGRSVNAEGKIVSKDGQGIFGSPTADSDRTKVTEQTRRVLMLIYHPPGAPEEKLARVIEAALERIKAATGGTAVEKGIFTCE